MTAEIVDVGAGTAEADYEGKGVAGRIVLAYGAVAAVTEQAVWERGAAGIISYPDPSDDRHVAYPDQIRWTRLPVESPDGRPATFAFVLSLRQGLALRQRLAEAGTPITVPAVVDADLDSQPGRDPWQVMVEAYIPGTEPISARTSSSRVTCRKRSSRPTTMRAGRRARWRWRGRSTGWSPRGACRGRGAACASGVTEISSQRQYFADHPEAHRRMWVNINHDMPSLNTPPRSTSSGRSSRRTATRLSAPTQP